MMLPHPKETSSICYMNQLSFNLQARFRSLVRCPLQSVEIRSMSEILSSAEKTWSTKKWKICDERPAVDKFYQMVVTYTAGLGDHIRCCARVDRYRAAICIATRSGAELTILIFARAGNVSLDLNGPWVYGGGSWRVRHDRKPGDPILCTNAKVDWSIVAQGLGRATPLASLRSTVSRRVEVVLG